MMKKSSYDQSLAKILLISVAIAIIMIVVIHTVTTFMAIQIEWYPSKLDNVIITINKKEFKSGDILVFTVKNLSEKILWYGYDFKIEFLNSDGKWVYAKWLFPYGVLRILRGLPFGDSFSQTVKLFPVCEGTYRLIKELDTDTSTYTFYIYFRVIEGTSKEDLAKANLSADLLEEFYKACGI